MEKQLVVGPPIQACESVGVVVMVKFREKAASSEEWVVCMWSIFRAKQGVVISERPKERQGDQADRRASGLVS